MARFEVARGEQLPGPLHKGLGGGDLLGRRARLAHRLHPSEQVIEPERLLHVVLGPVVLPSILGEPPPSVDGRHHHHRHVAGARGRLDPLARLEAMDLGEHGVEQHHIGDHRLGEEQRLLAVGGRLDRVAARLQHALHQVAESPARRPPPAPAAGHRSATAMAASGSSAICSPSCPRLGEVELVDDLDGLLLLLLLLPGRSGQPPRGAGWGDPPCPAGAPPRSLAGRRPR